MIQDSSPIAHSYNRAAPLLQTQLVPSAKEFEDPSALTIGRGGGSTATNSDGKICHFFKTLIFSDFFLNFLLCTTDFHVIKANSIVFKTVE